MEKLAAQILIDIDKQFSSPVSSSEGKFEESLALNKDKNTILFKGTFSPQEIETQIDCLRNYLKISVLDEVQQRRIVMLAIEQVDNLLSHSMPDAASNGKKLLCVLALEHSNQQYVLHTIGTVQEKHFERLKKYCAHINRLGNRQAVSLERDAELLSKSNPLTMANYSSPIPHAGLGISKMAACARDAIRIRFTPDNSGYGTLSISSPC